MCNNICHSKIKRHLKVRACDPLGITPLGITGNQAKSLKEIATLEHISHAGH